MDTDTLITVLAIVLLTLGGLALSLALFMEAVL